jgi:SNF2 family DNA or RNA helicase
MLERLRAGAFVRQRQPFGLSLHPYQIDTALKVVEELDGSAILADEVGLGKTIEAGLIRAELWARGLRGPTLVLTPGGLVGQWRREWREKFGWATDGTGPNPVDIVSLDTAKRDPHRTRLAARQWALVIVDEAHHLKNPRTLNHELVAALPRRHLLLLTATPMENQLTELYHLVTLVKPGLFGSYLQFYRQFILDKRTPKNARELRRLLSGVMVRHQRGEVGQALPEREVTLLPIKLTPVERRLYDRLTGLMRQEYQERIRRDLPVMPLITMQRELCSSPAAVLPTLKQAAWLGGERDRLEGLAREATWPAKIRAAADLVRFIGDKVLIFTEFRATQDLLVERLVTSGANAAAFHGGLTAAERESRIRWFRETGQVLVSTEAGGQGLNLQFCHHVVNFDLPWNPMRIEQRIGRIHRLGQDQAVRIYNLFAADTLEEDILRLLHEKIDLFRQVVGELDVILRHLERRGRRLEGRLLNILMTAGDREEVSRRLNQLAREFTAARERLAWPEDPEKGREMVD